YVRSIPNWPRYSIQGDARLGNHDLLIRNVTKSDAGSFECQVSPADGHPPLRRQTTLSILIKPSQPVVIAPSGEPQPLPNGQLIVPRHAINSSTSSEMQNYLRLICESHGGVPPPTFEWFHNGISVKPERVDDPEEQDGMPVGGQSRTGSKEIHSVSVILLRDKLQTGDRIVCLVSNKATLRSKLLSHQKMRSELIVVIHSPPGDPEIIDWSRSSDQSNIFVEGAQFEATCRADPAGNPPGELFWRWERPRQPLETSVDSRLPKVTLDIVAQIVSAVPPEHVVHQYSEGKLLSKVRIPLLKSEYHGLDLVCAVKHQVGPEKSARIPILVRYGPESVYIHGPEETTDILKQTPKFGTNMTSFEVKTLDLHNRLTYVYLDRPQYLLCMTGTYYDQAVIQWFGLSNRSGEWREIQPLETFSRKTANASNRFIMFSIVKLVSTNVERAAFEWVGIKCKAGQTPGQFTVENQTVLRIYEPPGKPTITGYEPGNLFQEETNLTLDCEATAGSPPGYLLWMTSFDRKTDDELQLINSTSRMNAQSKLTSSFEITLNRANNVTADRKQHWYFLSVLLSNCVFSSKRCVSVNDGYNVSERQTSLPVRLEVAYAATTINLTVSDGFGRLIVPRDGIHRIPKTIPDNPFAFINSSVATAESDTIISITCHVERSNPRPLIQWRRYDCPVTTNVSGNYSLEESAMRKHCAVTPLKGEDDNAQSTNVVRSRISISLNWSHHGDFIECFTQPPATYHSGQDVSSAESNSRFLSTGSSSGLREYVVLNIRFKPVFIRPSDHRQQRAQQIAMDDENYPTPQYIAIEGGTVDLDLIPLANPPVHKLVWYKENQQLISSPAHTNRDGGQMRIFIENSRLRISPVEVSDMSYYTLIASNTMGSTRFKFFLNLIGKPIINITATGKKAQLECEARANPTPTENAVRWRRISHSFTGMDYATQLPRPNTVSEIPKKTEEESLADSVTGIRCNKGKWHNGFKYFAKCWSKSPGTLTSLLTIYDLGPSDVGRYQCHMDNAIGSPAVRIVDLIYPFAPRIIHIQRWSKAAPGPVTGSLDSENTETNQSPQTNGIRRQARLTCVIAAEPQPEVTWSREPANLTLVEGGQFRSQMKLIHPGLYHAILYLSQPRDEDNGLYFCKASNLVGEDSGRVELMKASKPDVPQVPRLVNATSTTLAVTWTQGFNGGPKQIFQLRWASNENPESYTQTEVEEVLESETVTHVISAYDPIPDKEAMHDEARAKSRIGVGGGHWDIQHQNENRNGFVGERGGSEPGAIQSGLVGQTSGDKATLTIVMASSFGAIVLIANLLIILLLAHRKRKKSGLQQKSSITVFPGNELMQLCPSGLSFNDINGEQRHMYAAYGEGASLSEDVLVQNRSTDQPGNILKPRVRIILFTFTQD
ncbi:immunoglobulin domain protein, partial [Opisthorchis viverrini]